MPRGEGVAAAGFEVTFQGLRLCESFECDVGFDFPRHEFECMGNLTGIMLGKTSAEIRGAADVTLVGAGETAEYVGVVHGIVLI